MRKLFKKRSAERFLLLFVLLFPLLYYFNIFYFGITSPGNHYSSFLDEHLNYIRLLRHLLLQGTALVLRALGFATVSNDTELLVAGRGTIQLVYSCLGLGVMSFLSAFVLAYPKEMKQKLTFLFCSLLSFQVLNVMRFALLALFGSKTRGVILDHHTLFNLIIYSIIALSLYLWAKSDEQDGHYRGKNKFANVQ